MPAQVLGASLRMSITATFKMSMKNRTLRACVRRFVLKVAACCSGVAVRDAGDAVAVMASVAAGLRTWRCPGWRRMLSRRGRA